MADCDGTLSSELVCGSVTMMGADQRLKDDTGLGHFHDDKGRFPSHWFHPMLVSGSRQILSNLGHELNL